MTFFKTQISLELNLGFIFYSKYKEQHENKM